MKNALKSEVPLILRPWFGRADYFWAGGWSRLVWTSTFFGDWLLDLVMYRMFKMNVLERVLKQEEAQKKLN